MKVNRAKFVEVLGRLSPALGINILVPEFQYYQIDGDHVQTFDGVLIADSMFPMDTGLKCSIPREVLSLLTSLDIEEIDLAVKDDELQIRTTKLEGKFSILAPPKFQSLYTMDKGMILVDPKLIDDVVEGLGFCRFGVSKDATAGPKCGVQINRDTIFSTDRYRVVKWDLSGDSGLTCSMPLKFIDLLKKNQNKISKLGCLEDESFVAILDDGTYISTCLLQGDYPDLLQYFPDKADYEQIEFGEKLAVVIDRHLALLKDMNPLDREMLIEIKEGICTLTSKMPEKSNLVEHIDVKMDESSEISFSINPTFLKEISNRCSSFRYFDGGLILFEADKLQYLMRAGK